MVEIITEKDLWTSVLQQFDWFDSYHTYDYHNITKDDDEQSVLLYYTEENKAIALPLLVKEIEGTPYKDATSVYGYAGPVTQNICDNFDNIRFKNQVHNFFLDNNIISVFSRLHPYITLQRSVLKNIGEITKMGNIVNIDITEALETQKGSYQKRLKTYINKTRKVYSVTTAKTKDEIFKFIELYYENMRRVNAHSSYFFKHEYFLKLLESKDFKTEILIAICNDTQKIIAGAMFIKKNKMVQYHLSGCSEEYLHLNPIKLLIDEARIIATHEKYSYFNLGGGKGAKEDSLFQFKSGFSKDFRSFSLWKYIVNQEVYENLVKEKLKSVPLALQPQYLANFPYYRDCVS